MTLKLQVSSNFPASIIIANLTQMVTAAGTTTVAASTEVLIFNKLVASVSPCNLPDGSLRDGIPLDIYDFTGLAGDITLTPVGGQKIMGANNPWVIGSGGVAQAGGSVRLVYYASIPGWVVRA